MALPSGQEFLARVEACCGMVTMQTGRHPMKIFNLLATTMALMMVSVSALAQVPPDIAAGIRKIGPISDPPSTSRLYAPLFEQQKDSYLGVTVMRDLVYGPDSLNRIDVFTAGPSASSGKMRSS